MLTEQKHNPKTLKSNESTWGWEGVSINFFSLNDYIPCPVAYNRLGQRNECLLPPTPRYFHSLSFVKIKGTRLSTIVPLK